MNLDFTELYSYVDKRKSVRQFIQEPLEQGIIDELIDFLSRQEMPLSEIDWDFDTLPYVDMVRIGATEPGVKAPHYLVLRGERVNGSLQNGGYLGALAALWLCAKGLGSCWQGNINVTEDFPDSLPYVAALAFGKPAEPALRDGPEQFRRGEMRKMIMGDFSGGLEQVARAVQLAPSSMNRQPVQLMSVDGQIHVFRKHVLLKNPVISYPQCIDAGVAMGHMAVAAAALGKKARFHKRRPEPKWGNRIYQVTMTME